MIVFESIDQQEFCSVQAMRGRPSTTNKFNLRISTFYHNVKEKSRGKHPDSSKTLNKQVVTTVKKASLVTIRLTHVG